MSEITVNDRTVEAIEIEIYEPIADKPGYVRHTGNRTILEVVKELNDKLKQLIPDQMNHLDYGFNPDYKVRDKAPKTPWPEYWHIACFAVTGGSEGHYIHIEIINNDGKLENIAIAKTLYEGQEGKELACDIAKYSMMLLQA